MSDLLIAAGGGGDPVGTAIVHAATSRDPHAVIATYAWERLEVDPTPGPLGPAAFTGWGESAGGHRFTGRTTAVPPARSTLPRLSESLGPSLLLLDPYQGVPGLARQIRRAADASGCGQVRIVDIGGDILTHGDEPTLQSPLPDALTLAACATAGVTASVHVAGPGLDGEIPEGVLLPRLTGGHLTPTDQDVRAAAAALAWHPSEASALFAAAATGRRGTVRTVGDEVRLTPASGQVHHLTLDQALAHNPLARALYQEQPGSLEDAERLALRTCGFSELAREREAAERLSATAPASRAVPVPTSRDQVLYMLWQSAPGAGCVTFRYAARVLGLSWRDIPRLRELTKADGPLLPLVM
ncbi:DUF1152 domain-containing protein [Streptomyces sp. DSM 41987]|uniref:DUF1152 domain-containing protein n=1 Tax=Streptomyces TaxID=1883 RepID=UPI0018E0103B|nr:DUF1152 domain-containing protein [Streptomyces fildesensis]